jgi:accessory gene regulator protein AgrB
VKNKENLNRSSESEGLIEDHMNHGSKCAQVILVGLVVSLIVLTVPVAPSYMFLRMVFIVLAIIVAPINIFLSMLLMVMVSRI